MPPTSPDPRSRVLGSGEAPRASTPGLLPIGELAARTGLSSDTLRMWERRYGRPTPIRLPSGHRRYCADDVAWLRRVAEAITLGVPVREAVCASPSVLDGLLRRQAGRTEPCARILQWIEHVRGMRASALTAALREDWRQLGPERFLDERVGRMMTEVGLRWAAGDLDVRHEHFATEVCAEFLRGARTEIDAAVPGTAPLVAVTTLAGEHHTLAMHMGAVALSISGCRVQVLGGDLPIEEIARAAIDLDADAVAISVSLANGGVATDRALSALREHLEPRVRLLVGGGGDRGPRRGPRGIDHYTDLTSLTSWAARL